MKNYVEFVRVNKETYDNLVDFKDKVYKLMEKITDIADTAPLNTIKFYRVATDVLILRAWGDNKGLNK